MIKSIQTGNRTLVVGEELERKEMEGRCFCLFVWVFLRQGFTNSPRTHYVWPRRFSYLGLPSTIIIGVGHHAGWESLFNDFKMPSQEDEKALGNEWW